MVVIEYLDIHELPCSVNLIDFFYFYLVIICYQAYKLPCPLYLFCVLNAKMFDKLHYNDILFFTLS